MFVIDPDASLGIYIFKPSSLNPIEQGIVAQSIWRIFSNNIA